MHDVAVLVVGLVSAIAAAFSAIAVAKIQSHAKEAKRQGLTADDGFTNLARRLDEVDVVNREQHRVIHHQIELMHDLIRELHHKEGQP